MITSRKRHHAPMDYELRQALDESVCAELNRMAGQIGDGGWLDSELADRAARVMLYARTRITELLSRPVGS